MKKSLIIFFSLFCLNLGANAIGVDCWEEYTTSNKTEPTTSALRTALTNAGATPILVSQIYELTFYEKGYGSDGLSSVYSTSRIPFEFIILTKSYYSDTTYVPYKYYYYYYYSYSNNGVSVNNFISPNMTHVTGYSIYTYCVVNNNSSSSDSSSTGSVNFIIKATS